MGVKVGHLGKVTLGSSTIVAMGTWTLSGITAEPMPAETYTAPFGWSLFKSP